MRKKRRYYVCVRSNWQGDRWSPVAGPFSSRKKAEEERPKYEYHPHRVTGGIDIASQLHARVFSRHELTRLGYPRTSDGEFALVENMAEQEDPKRPLSARNREA